MLTGADIDFLYHLSDIPVALFHLCTDLLGTGNLYNVSYSLSILSYIYSCFGCSGFCGFRCYFMSLKDGEVNAWHMSDSSSGDWIFLSAETKCSSLVHTARATFPLGSECTCYFCVNAFRVQHMNKVTSVFQNLI